eukprot:3321367-Pleurochrysis_carterae.AAC.1
MFCVVGAGGKGRGGGGPTPRFRRRLRAEQVRAHLHTRGGARAGRAGTLRRGAPAAGGCAR